MWRIIRIILLVIFGLLLILPWTAIANRPIMEQQAQEINAQTAPEVIVITEPIPQGCEWAALNISGSPAQRVEEPEEPVINARLAEIIADRAIHKALNLSEDFSPSHVYGPVLVRVDLSNGESRLVWARVWSTYPADRDAVAYLDAVTGEPLVIYRGMYLGDPFFAGTDCTNTMYTAENVVNSPQMWIAGALLWDVFVLLLAGVAAGIAWAIRRVRSREAR